MNCRNSSEPTSRSTWGWLKAGLFGAAIALFGTAQAQTTVTIGTGTLTSAGLNGTPIYRSSGTSTFHHSKSIQLITQAQMSAAGVIPGAAITQWGYNKTGGQPSGTNAWTLNVYLKNSSATTLASGTAWNTMISGATLAYTATINSGNMPATGYWLWPISGFTYTGGGVECYIEWFPVGTLVSPFTTASFPYEYTAAGNQAMGNSASTAIAGTNTTWTTQARFYNTRLTYLADPCAGTPNAGTTVASVSSSCGTLASTTLSLSGASGGTGMSYAWEFNNGSGWIGLGGNTSTLTVNGIATNTDFRCTLTCANSGLSSTPSTPVTVAIYPVVTAGVSASPTGPFCGAANTTLTATGGLTYAWAPATGLSGTTGSSVTSTVANTTTYTVTATGAGGCTGTATVPVQIIAAPILSSVTANPNPTCFGGNSQLQVNESLAFKATLGSLAPMTGATTLLTTSNDDTPTAASTPIGFSFVFNGTPYTDFSVSPDGWILLGTTVATSQFSNSTVNTTNIPKIYPYWDDLATGTTGNVQYVVTGSAPNRILVVQWFVTIPRNTAGAANSTFQAWLYENGGQIDFRYGAMGPGAMSASVGTTVNATTFRSVTISTGTMSTVTANDANAGQPVSGMMYSFNFPASSYAWNPGTFLSATNIANPLATGINVASQTYTVTATNSDNCTSTGSVTVNTAAPITAATISGNLAFCTGGSTTLTAAPSDGAGPYTFLWSPGGQTTAAISVTAPGSYSCQVTDNCGGTVITNSVNVVENSLPPVAVTPTSAAYCTNNTALALSASGASTYAWAPATGLSATTGADVNASPAATTTYTVTGTDGNGCVNTATTVITNNGIAPVISSVTATPAIICSGANSQLNAVATVPTTVNQMLFSSSTGALDPMTGATTVLTTSNDDSPSTLQSIGFAFSFNGVNYTDWSCTPDGFIKLGSPATTADFSNDLLEATNLPKICAYYDDLATGTDGHVRSLVTGTAPNRILKVQWFVTIPRNTTGAANSTFQCWLYETSGTIEFRYGTMGAAAMTASLGLTAGATNFQSITLPGPTVSTVTANNAVSGQPASGTVYQFMNPPSATYSWSPATYLNNAAIANPLASGVVTNETYTVTATSGLCSSTGTVSVTLNTTDTDGDGTIDCVDGCPNDPNKTAPGVCGCGVSDVDTDADGTADCNDGCPNDPNKIAPGQCGCGVPDTDSDSDGTADCNDGCPADPAKVAPGTCGCGNLEPGAACNDGDPLTSGDVVDANCVCAGTPGDCLGVPNGTALPGTPCDDNNVCTINDTWSPLCVCTGTFQDTDGDGTCDANDGCPNDPNKIAPGICGCGVADTDSDGDGVANCIDPCPNLPFLQNGDPCNDGNPCTINDVVTNCACAGTPAPVVASVTPSSAVYCTPGSGITLTASGGATYSWAPAAGLSATTGSPVTATPASATTYTVTATNAAGCSGTATAAITTGTKPANPVMSANPTTVCPGSNSQLGATIGTTPTYCIPALSTGCSFPDIITNVNIAGINRSSVCDNTSGSNGYSNFATPTGALVAGSTGNAYSVSTGGDIEGAAAWIDYNQNGVFEASENLFNGLAGTNPATYSGTFAVPAGAFNGTTRMRVRCMYNTNPTASGACTAATWGETEDYTVTITGGAPNCAAGINFSWSPTTFLNNPLVCNPVATAVTAATTYTVTATNAAGCSSTGTIGVTVETLDTDGDGTVNCLDGCPNDPNKIAPGQCGCGVPDTDTDADGTANCNDGCPNDPNKIAPGLCGCGVADTDTDSDGTPDCNDLCPTDPNKIVPGQCGCGIADTDGDGDGIADCNDLCPTLPGTVGTPCNDNNPGTINDALDANCVCTGTVPNCAFNTVLLDLVTDNDGAQTSWDVVNVGTSTAVCSGSGYLPNQTITLDCCLPDGCYELRVFDSAGDGMANGTTGGYVLRTNTGKRIIDNSGDGIFTSVSQIAGNLGFCVPLGTDGLIPAHCDKSNWLTSDIIQAALNSAVTGQFGITNATSGYQWWFFNPDGGYSRRILQTHASPGTVTGPPASQRASYLKLSSIVTQPLPLFTNLNVRVRTQVAGVFSEFGPACRFRIDPPCATTQLTSIPDPVTSCGASGLSLSSVIYATNVPGATTYQFEFSKPGYLRRIAQSTRSTALSFVTLPLENNSCYQVRVRVSFDGAQTYCPFGIPCNIALGTTLCPGAGMALEAGAGTEASEVRMTLWPNPNDGSLVNVTLNGFDATVNTVLVDVTDVYGKLVSTRTIPVQDGYMNTTLPFEQTLAPGLYLVNLQAGEHRYTERMVIQ